MGVERNRFVEVKRNQIESGFTLLELVIVIAMLGMIVVTVMGLFFRAIRGSGKTESIVSVDQDVAFSMALMQGLIRNAQGVISVGGVDCPGIGESLTILSWDGGTTTFSLTSEGRIASNSSEITEASILIENFSFECVRIEGVPDQILIEFDASRTNIAEGVSSSKHYESTINMRNY